METHLRVIEKLRLESKQWNISYLYYLADLQSICTGKVSFTLATWWSLSPIVQNKSLRLRASVFLQDGAIYPRPEISLLSEGTKTIDLWF